MTMQQERRVADYYRKSAMKDVSQGGKVFWVDSTNAAGSNTPGFGLTPEYPFLSIDYAIGQCTANAGYTIYAMPGHTETVTAAGGLDCDVADITIHGLGQGENRPRIVFTTDGGADTDIDAAGITIYNFIVECQIDLQTNMIDVNADDFRLDSCEIRASSGATPVSVIDIDGGGANTCDRCTIVNCTGLSALAAGADTFIKITNVHDGIVIRGNHIQGDFAVAAISSGAAFTTGLIADNYISNANAGDWCIELTAAATGMIVNNRLYSDAAATCLDPGSMKCVGNRMVNAIDSSDVAIPLGTSDQEDIANALYGADGVVTWNAGAAPANGVSISEGLRFVSEAITDGAAFSQTVDPGGTARTSVELVLADIGAMLAGSAGITTFPAAAAPANAVSIAEVLRYISEQQSIRYVTRSASTLSNGLDLFTVTGTIALKYLYLVCATANDGTASTIQFNAVPTVGSATTLSAASASIANAAAGATITLAGTALSTAALYAANGPNLIANPGTVLVPAGVIDVVVGVGSTTGTWSAHLVYEPLSAGASVAAA